MLYVLMYRVMSSAVVGCHFGVKELIICFVIKNKTSSEEALRLVLHEV
jgi:hypothetical protein